MLSASKHLLGRVSIAQQIYLALQRTLADIVVRQKKLSRSFKHPVAIEPYLCSLPRLYGVHLNSFSYEAAELAGSILRRRRNSAVL